MNFTSMIHKKVEKVSNIGYSHKIPKTSSLNFKLEYLSDVIKCMGYNIQHTDIQHNSINGVLYKNKNKYFFKFLFLSDFKREFRGYEQISSLFPVPKMIEINLSIDSAVIIYEYEKSIKKMKDY
ncbi:MAG: hypothetical protein ACI4RJ_01165 [Alphaproteobacteria bacterium]